MILLQSHKAECLAEISAKLPVLLITAGINIALASRIELSDIIIAYVDRKYFPSGFNTKVEVGVTSYAVTTPAALLLYCFGRACEPYAVNIDEDSSNLELKTISITKVRDLDKLIYDQILHKYRDNEAEAQMHLENNGGARSRGETPVSIMNQNLINNRVIVRIWNSSINGGHNVGHVSIQMPFNYISLWPANYSAGPIKKFFETRPPHLLMSVDGDLRLEGRPAEITICLYKLNVEKMQDKFNEIKKKLNGWTLFGPNRLLNDGTSHSCSSLAFTILKAGDLPLDYLIFSSSASPDKIGEVMIAAKGSELKEYPETAALKFDGETNVESFNYKKVSCTLS